MDVSLLNFVQECKQLSKQALGNRADVPASGGFARWKHVVIHCIRLKDNHTYREVIDRISLMDAVCEVSELDRDDIPKPSTLCKAFDRLKMWVWRQLLRALRRSNCLPLGTVQSMERISNAQARP